MPPIRPAWLRPALGICACSQLRRTARAASAVYDEFLAPARLTVTQYAILVTIGRAGTIRHTGLADELGMERTTLTRNLRPLGRQKLIKTVAGADRREHFIHLAHAGVKRLDRAYPLWEKAQRHFLSHVGERNLSQLRAALGAVVDAIANP